MNTSYSLRAAAASTCNLSTCAALDASAASSAATRAATVSAPDACCERDASAASASAACAALASASTAFASAFASACAAFACRSARRGSARVLGTELFEQADRHEHETTKGHDETADDHEEDLRGAIKGHERSLGGNHEEPSR